MEPVGKQMKISSCAARPHQYIPRLKPRSEFQWKKRLGTCAETHSASGTDVSHSPTKQVEEYQLFSASASSAEALKARGA